MCKAFIFAGREEIAHHTVERYQLLIGCKDITALYDYSKPRTVFLNKLATNFAHRMLKEKTDLEPGVYNGSRMNTHTHLPERIQELEDAYLKQFRESLNARLHEPKVVIPAHYQN